MKHVYDKEFKYVHSNSTDLNKTFERVRREMEEKAKETAKVVKPLNKARVPNGR